MDRSHQGVVSTVGYGRWAHQEHRKTRGDNNGAGWGGGTGVDRPTGEGKHTAPAEKSYTVRGCAGVPVHGSVQRG